VGAREGRRGPGSMGSSGFIPNPYPDLAEPGLVLVVGVPQIANAQDREFPQSNPKWRSSIPGKSSTLAREQADMIPVAYIEHQLPGRVRLRVPSRRGEVPFFEKVVRELSKHPAIRELSATPLTGSITLHYFEPLHPIVARRGSKAVRDQPIGTTKQCKSLETGRRFT